MKNDEEQNILKAKGSMRMATLSESECSWDYKAWKALFESARVCAVSRAPKIFFDEANTQFSMLPKHSQSFSPITQTCILRLVRNLWKRSYVVGEEPYHPSTVFGDSLLCLTQCMLDSLQFFIEKRNLYVENESRGELLNHV